MAARISEIFLNKESGKRFLSKKSKSNKKNLAIGRGGCVARVSYCFLEVSHLKKMVLFLSW